jgi:hypothetical protein
MRTTKASRAWAGLCAAALVAMGGCSNAHLSPAPTASRLPGGVNATVAATAGVRVTARAGVWAGSSSIRESVTPVLIQVDNRSGAAIRICYDQIRLRGADGRPYAALPPYDVEGAADAPVLGRTYPAVTPLYSHRRFWIAPYYARIYPGLAAFPGPFPFHPSYYRNRYAHWGALGASLPTPDMLRRAVPEGVLGDGGQVSGFLYFQRVDPGARVVTLSAEIVNARAGQELGRVRIPFRVEALAAAPGRGQEGRNHV